MENKKIEVKKVSKIKLNMNYIEFIGKVMKENLMSKDREELRKIYIKNVKVKSFNNVNRVNERIKRDGLKIELMKVLKEKNIDIKEFEKVSNDLVSKIREKKVSNYLEVEVNK